MNASERILKLKHAAIGGQWPGFVPPVYDSLVSFFLFCAGTCAACLNRSETAVEILLVPTAYMKTIGDGMNKQEFI